MREIDDNSDEDDDVDDDEDEIMYIYGKNQWGNLLHRSFSTLDGGASKTRSTSDGMAHDGNKEPNQIQENSLSQREFIACEHNITYIIIIFSTKLIFFT